MKRFTIIMTFLIFAALSLFGQDTEFFTSSDGKKIAYQQKGHGDTTIIFVHGWCCNKEFWKLQTQYFSQKYTTLSLDMGGYGESEQREIHSFQQWGDDIVSLIESLHLKNVIIGGHSVGGYMVLNAATKLKDRVKAIVGADSFRGKLERTYTADYAQEAADGLDESTFEKDMRDNERWFVPQSDPELKKWITEEMVSCPIHTAAQGLKAYYEYRNLTLDEFKKVTCDIYGINTEGAPFDLEFFETHQIPFHPHYMSNVGHFLMMDNPNKFNSLLEDILESLR